MNQEKQCPKCKNSLDLSAFSWYGDVCNGCGEFEGRRLVRMGSEMEVIGKPKPLLQKQCCKKHNALGCSLKSLMSQLCCNKCPSFREAPQKDCCEKCIGKFRKWICVISDCKCHKPQKDWEKDLKAKMYESFKLWRPRFYHQPPTHEDFEDLWKTDILFLIHSQCQATILEDIEVLEYGEHSFSEPEGWCYECDTAKENCKVNPVISTIIEKLKAKLEKV